MARALEQPSPPLAFGAKTCPESLPRLGDASAVVPLNPRTNARTILVAVRARTLTAIMLDFQQDWPDF
jgi:hypothetical protein